VFSHECCKSRSGCCTCCNGYTSMLQEFVQNVSSVRASFYLDVTKVHLFCKHIFQVFHLDVACVRNGYTRAFKFFWCFENVSNVCSKYFQLFRIYVVSVSSKCYKSRYGVAHVAMRLTCRSRLPQLLGRHRGSSCGRLRLADASTMRIHKRGM
jgi:hypothetical protein